MIRKDNKMSNLANETDAAHLDRKKAFEDRQLFVHNLGELLSQTRERIIGASLSKEELVTITYDGGYTQKINVNMDSYMAIIRDVARGIEL
jgi:hypothetical protein